MVRDGGSTHTLEATIVACIMLAAAFTVMNHQVAPSSLSTVERILQQRVDACASITTT